MLRREFLKTFPASVAMAASRKRQVIGRPGPEIHAVVWRVSDEGLTEVTRAAVADKRTVSQSGWTLRSRILKVDSEDHFEEFRIAFRRREERTTGAVVGVQIELDSWSTRNYVLVPAAVYGGNRFTTVPTHYPTPVPDRFIRPDPPIFTSEITRLSLTAGPSFIEHLTGDISTPAIGFVSAAHNDGFLLLLEQGSRFGDHGLCLEESADRDRAFIRVMAPGHRRLRPTINGRVPADDHGAEWATGDELEVRFRIHRFHARRPQDLFDRFANLRQSLVPPAPRRHELPFSHAWDLLEARYNAENWNEGGGFYWTDLPTDENSNPLIGWEGGAMGTQAMLFDGTDLTRMRARKNLDTVFVGSPAPSGLLHTIRKKGKWQGDFDVGERHAALSRCEGDGLFFAIKQFDLLRKQGELIPAAWESAVRGQADALVRLWRKSGQFGNAIDLDTGDIAVGGSTSGASISGGLALASGWFKDPTYLAVARSSAEFYAQQDMATGITTGGPGDALQAPDSESSHGLLQSFVAVWEATGERRWMNYAEEMARQFSSWVVSYDYRFPSGSTFAQAGMQTTGAVWANAQNRHAAPSICTSSGDALLRIFRATGDRFYLNLLRDIAHGIPQYLSRSDRRLRCDPTEAGRLLPDAWMVERVQMSDWELPGVPQGEVFCASNDWTTTALMLTWIEVPGLYVQVDSGLICALDHVEAKLVRHTGRSAHIDIHNPTRFPARIRVLAESRSASLIPLPLNALLHRPVVTVPAGGRVHVEVFADGSVNTASFRLH